MLATSDEGKWHIERADGFLDLNMIDQARRELEQVNPFERRYDNYIYAALRLALADARWGNAAQFARTLISRSHTREPDLYVRLAYAVRRAEGIEAARIILLQVLKRFPKIAVIPFNLACYACRLGQPDEAMAYLKKAFKLDPGLREDALDDEDLQPIRERLED